LKIWLFYLVKVIR